MPPLPPALCRLCTAIHVPAPIAAAATTAAAMIPPIAALLRPSPPELSEEDEVLPSALVPLSFGDGGDGSAPSFWEVLSLVVPSPDP